MDSRGQILLLDSQTVQYSMRQPLAKSPPSSIASKAHTENIYYQQSHAYLEDDSSTETDIFIPQNLDEVELAYKFPPNSNTVDDLTSETVNQPRTLAPMSPIVDWNSESDSSRVDMKDTVAKDRFTPTDTDAIKYKLSWASSISAGENAMPVFSPTADILPSDLIRQHTAGSFNHIVTQMVEGSISRHSSGYSNVIDDEDSASVGTEEFDNWIQGSKVSSQTVEGERLKGSASAFEQHHIHKVGASAKRVSQHSVSPELSSTSTVMSVNHSGTPYSPSPFHAKQHAHSLLQRQPGQTKEQRDEQFELPDKLILEYKDSSVLVIESSVKEDPNDAELASESVLLRIGPIASPMNLQHAAATKIQAIWRGYKERALNPPSSSRALLLIMTLSMKFQQKCNGSVDRKLRGLKHRVLQEARFRVRSERQLQKLGDVNRKERDELCRLLDNENATLEAQEQLMRESADKAEVTYRQLQNERHERENLERVVQLAAKEINAQAEREMQRSKEMDIIQRRVEKLANELKLLKHEQTSSHQRTRRSISPTHSIKSLSQSSNAHESTSPDPRTAFRHRLRPSAVPRLETGPSSSNANAPLYQKIPSGKDILKFTSANAKTNAMLLKGKSLIPTNSTTTISHDRRR